MYLRALGFAGLFGGCIGLSIASMAAVSDGFCIIDNSVTDKLGGDYQVIGEGKPLDLVKGRGVRETDDGLVRVFAIDGSGNEVPGGEHFFLYPELFAFETAAQSTNLAGSAGTGGGYGSGGGGARICE